MKAKAKRKRNLKQSKKAFKKANRVVPRKMSWSIGIVVALVMTVYLYNFHDGPRPDVPPIFFFVLFLLACYAFVETRTWWGQGK